MSFRTHKYTFICLFMLFYSRKITVLFFDDPAMFKMLLETLLHFHVCQRTGQVRARALSYV